MKIHIVIPTIMTQPDNEFQIVNYLHDQLENLNLDFHLYFVCNTDMEEFKKYTPVSDRVTKHISNLQFSISRAVNSIYESITYTDDDILGFVQSDCYFENHDWIKYYIEILTNPEYNAGVLGQRPHLRTNVITLKEKYRGKFSLFDSFWNDGVMLFKASLLNSIGMFDENYFGDCESQDFCYRAHEAGFKNYWLSDNEAFFKFKHLTINFERKAKYDQKLFESKVNQSRKYFDSKWRNFELKNMNKTSW